MSAFLTDFSEEIKRQKANVFSISEYCDEKLETVQLVTTNPCQDAYSVAKVYVVTAIGMLVDRGLLSVSEYVTEILKDECPQEYQSVWDCITVDMLLLHRVPLTEGFLDIDVYDATEYGKDYLAYILNTAVTDEAHIPEMCYTDAAYYLLSRVVEKKADMKLDDFLWENLLFPTGCREAAWSHCPMGHVVGATGLYIRTEEIAKLGAVYLNKGVWRETRILSENWVDTVLSRGYELKVQKNGCTFGKGGMRGQMLMLIPSKRRVVVYMGCGEYSFEKYIAEY